MWELSGSHLEVGIQEISPAEENPLWRKTNFLGIKRGKLSPRG
jgi:hypothetical protein